MIWDRSVNSVTCVIGASQSADEIAKDASLMVDEFLNGGFAYYSIKMEHRYSIEMDEPSIILVLAGQGCRGIAHDRKKLIKVIAKAATFARNLPEQ